MKCSPNNTEDYNKEVDDADADIEAGEFIIHEDVTKS